MKIAALVIVLLLSSTATAAPTQTAVYPYAIKPTMHIPYPHRLMRIGLRKGVPTLWALHAPITLKSKALHIQWFKEAQRLTLEDNTNPNSGIKRRYLGAIKGRFYFLAYEASGV